MMSWQERYPSLLFCGLLLFGFAVEAQAYVTLKHQGNETKWNQDIQWKLHPSGSDDVPFEELFGALDAAFFSWSSVSCADLNFSYGGTANKTQNGVIHISFRESNWDPSVGDAAAYTVSEKYWGSGNIKKSTIVFNGVDQIWTTVASSTTYGAKTDIQGVATHEIGHALGLDHPFEREATMFFSGGSSELRSLEADDQRGVCYLYPDGAFQNGQACDSCSQQDQCLSGVCLTFPWEQNAAFCGADCSDAGDCPDNFSCVNVDGVGGQCVPENEYCSPSGGNVPLGGYCWGPAMCSSGLCLPVPGDAFCSQECVVGNPSSCPSGFQCFESSGSGGICIKEGSKGFGQECASPFECETSVCYLGVCSQSCSSSKPCPESAACTGGYCIPPGTVYYGDYCSKHTDCASGFCTGLPSNFCSQQCKVTPDCPPGATCTVGKYCSKITYSNEGGPCEVDGNCKDGLVCLFLNALGSGICRVPCDPIQDAGCAEGKGCFWVYDVDSQSRQGGCISDKGGALEGEACGPGFPACAPHLVCVDLPGTEPGYCARDCLLSTAAGCPSGACVELANALDPDQGVCLADPNEPGGEDVEESPPGAWVDATGSDTGESENLGSDAGSTVSLNLDGLSTQRPSPPADAVIYVPGSITKPSSSGSGGCASHLGSTSRSGLLFLLALVGIVVRRKRGILA